MKKPVQKVGVNHRHTTQFISSWWDISVTILDFNCDLCNNIFRFLWRKQCKTFLCLCKLKVMLSFTVFSVVGGRTNDETFGTEEQVLTLQNVKDCSSRTTQNWSISAPTFSEVFIIPEVQHLERLTVLKTNWGPRLTSGSSAYELLCSQQKYEHEEYYCDKTWCIFKQKQSYFSTINFLMN